MDTTSHCVSAHPRSRGENGIGTRLIRGIRGSSPLTRGKPLLSWAGFSVLRLIPAHAGKTTTVVGGVLSVAAHPRSRGENDVRDDDNRPFLGSSPLTRGKRSRPTRAGRGTSAHPRSRGENGAPGDEADVEKGSSPLTRGKPPPGQRRPHGRGLIPAHAGKTSLSRLIPSLPWAHPRSRGENDLIRKKGTTIWGSSPLTRGKPRRWGGVGDLRRLIPAHAGKTVRAGVSGSGAAAHPRSRGENLSGPVT